MAINGTAGNDNLQGTELDDISIFGYAGNDTIDGNGGNDIIDAGEGDDTVYGGNDNDTILGREGKDYLYGENGNDVIFGEAGNDYIWGGAGIDILRGGTGDDIYLISASTGDTADTITELANQGIDKVLSYSSYTLGANLENLELLYGAYSANGNNLDNKIIGNSFANSVSGKGGEDVLEGKDGNDFVYGDSGSDNLLGGSGNDSLYGGTNSDVLFGDEILIGDTSPVGNDYLNGGDGKDQLYGGRGNDTLTGEAGNDFLSGYGDSTTSEYDLLNGNGGADTFSLGYNGSFTSIDYLGSGYAIITDFKQSESDKIRVGGNLSEYTLQKTSNFSGTSALDTLIYRGSDLIAVAQDTTDVNKSLDFIV